MTDSKGAAVQPTPLEVTIATMPILTVIGLLILAGLWIRRRTQLSEMAHRERMAMIEKGLVPPPEQSAFEEIFGPAALAGGEAPAWRPPQDGSAQARYRTRGVTTIAIGIGLMLLLGVGFGLDRTGLGLGGAIAVLGVGLVVNGYLPVSSPAPAARQERVPMEPPGDGSA
jgi:hypothetical protein